MATWDEHGKAIAAPPAKQTWDEQGNLIPAQAASGPITPKEGESFADTMKRGAEYGKTVTPEQLSASAHSGYKKIPTVLGAALLAGPAIIGGLAIAPEVASSAVGGGITGSAAAGATGGAAQEIMNKALHAASGENVLNAQSAGDVGSSALMGGTMGAGLGLFEKVAGGLLASKLSRGAINASVGATARDVTYGNPAVGMLKAGVTSPTTGDLEAYKAALRLGAPPEQALVAAGGRIAQVTQKINQLAPQLEQTLSSVQTPLKVSEVIDKPLMKALDEISNNRAMTQAEKDGAVAQIGALQQSLKESLPETITPLQANQIKQAIGNRVNWAGNIAVTDEVKPAYRAVYGSLKNAVNKAVPGAAQMNEDLSNMLSAQTDLHKLMQAEEIGAGKGALGAGVAGIARRVEANVGRFLPGAAAVNNAVTAATPTVAGPTGASIADILRSKGMSLPTASPNQPGQPFHPGAGLE